MIRNLANRLLQTCPKQQSQTISKRYFESATTGEKFNYPRVINPFLKIPTQVSTLPYFVRRTQFLSLPVYSEFKNGRSRHLTVIRRIQGDSEALKKDLLKDHPEFEAYISQTNKHVVVRGLKIHEVRDWLHAKGF